MNILEMSAFELAKAIREGRISVVEAVGESFKMIDEKEPVLNAFITHDREKALEEARVIQNALGRGEDLGVLAGVPVAIKDNICTQGMRTTCASRMLDDFVPGYNATVVDKLKEAGAIIIGKTNMDEFAMGSTSETSYHGAVKNPYNTDCVAGGSSGGSCVAVSSGEAFAALGSDTGGSIRQPASFCNVVGLKPTYQTVARDGLIAYASGFDQIGPVTRDVRDCAMLLDVISGHDKKDSTSVIRENYNFSAALREDVKGMRIGILSDHFTAQIDDEVAAAIDRAIHLLEKLGASVEEFKPSLTDYAVPAYYTIATAEASSNLARFDGVKYGHRAENYDGLHNMYKKSRQEGFGEEVKCRIMTGSFVLSAGYYDEYYLKALKVRTLIKREFDEAFQKYDCIVGPVAPTTAFRIGESLKDRMKMYLGDVFTVVANLAGLPGISVPVGFSKSGMPIGMQIMGNSFREDNIIRTAYTCEQAMRRI